MPTSIARNATNLKQINTRTANKHRAGIATPSQTKQQETNKPKKETKQHITNNKQILQETKQT